jgi:hypothetical protein
MGRKRGSAVSLGGGASVALVGMLYAVLSLAETVSVVAVAAVLLGPYQLRRSARHALVYDRRPAPRRDGATTGAA